MLKTIRFAAAFCRHPEVLLLIGNNAGRLPYFQGTHYEKIH
jgi:hypothetical protein